MWSESSFSLFTFQLCLLCNCSLLRWALTLMADGHQNFCFCPQQPQRLESTFSLAAPAKFPEFHPSGFHWPGLDHMPIPEPILSPEGGEILSGQAGILYFLWARGENSPTQSCVPREGKRRLLKENQGTVTKRRGPSDRRAKQQILTIYITSVRLDTPRENASSAWWNS